MTRGDKSAVPYQNCKKLDAISSSSSSLSSSSWIVSSSSFLGYLVPLASLTVILGVREVLDEGTERGGLPGAFLTFGGE